MAMSISGIGAGSASMIQQFQQNLFNKIDANGDGTIDKSELESAVTGAGGSKASADALFAELDPNGSGSISEQQFEQNLPKPPMSEMMAAQLIGLQAQQGGESDSTLGAVSGLLGTSGSDGSGDSAQDALMDLIDAFGGSTSDSSSSSSSSTGSDLMAIAVQMMLMSFQQHGAATA
jgi:hypothetical protein